MADSQLTRSTMSDADREAVTQRLLSSGYDLEAPDFDYVKTVIYMATEDDENAMRLLLEKGTYADVIAGVYDFAIQIAARYGHDQIILLLLEQGADINARVGLYGTALQAASEYGHHQTAALLLEHGADVNVYGDVLDPTKDKDPDEEEEDLTTGGATALHLAAQEGYDSIVKLLLNHGADPNAPGGKYGSVLDMATRHGRYEVVQLLLQHGADVFAQDRHGLSIVQVAEAFGHFEIMLLLLDHGAK